jgi:hypothetical protein
MMAKNVNIAAMKFKVVEMCSIPKFPFVITVNSALPPDLDLLRIPDAHVMRNMLHLDPCRSHKLARRPDKTVADNFVLETKVITDLSATQVDPVVHAANTDFAKQPELFSRSITVAPLRQKALLPQK